MVELSENIEEVRIRRTQTDDQLSPAVADAEQVVEACVTFLSDRHSLVERRS